MDVVLSEGAILLEPLPVEGDIEDLPAPAIEVQPVAVFDELVLFVIDTFTEHRLHEDKGLLFELLIFLLDVPRIELVAVQFFVEFEPPGRLVLLEVVQVEARRIDYLPDIVPELAVVGHLDLGDPLFLASIVRISNLQSDVLDFASKEPGGS